MHFLSSLLSAAIFIALLCYVDCKRSSKLPEDIQLCKKDDPEIDKCLVNLFESLRPRLVKGMPEIGLPALDPLILPEVNIFRGNKGQMRAIGRDIKITGISNFKINSIKTNLDQLEIACSVSFPFLEYEGQYDVNMKFMNFPIKGKGPMRGNATDVTSVSVLKGILKENEDGEKYVEFTSAVVDVTVKDYSIRVDKLFSDKQLNDALNVIMNDKKSQSIQTAKPIVNKVASRMLLEMVNNIAKNFSFDEVFA